MRKLAILSVLLSLLVPVVAACQSAPATYQVTWRGYASLQEASAVVASGSTDLYRPRLIDTGDASITTNGVSTPYVVFRYEFVDVWCCVPEGFEHQRHSTRNAANIAAEAMCTAPNTRGCGRNDGPLATRTGSVAVPYYAVIWRTFTPPTTATLTRRRAVRHATE